MSLNRDGRALLSLYEGGIISCVALVAIVSGWVCARGLFPFMRFSDGRLEMQDFAYHYSIADMTPRGGQGSFYSSEARASALQKRCGEKFGNVCSLPRDTQPVGMSPIGFVLLFCLSTIFGGGSSGAFFGYLILVTLTFSIWIWLSFALARACVKNRVLLLPMGVILALYFATPFRDAIFHGQASFLVVGLIALSMLSRSPRSNGLLVSAVSLAAIKPHYLAFMMVFLVAAREWKGLLLSISALLALTALAAAVYGGSIFIEYIAVMRQYSAGMPFSWFGNPFNLSRYLPLRSNEVVLIGFFVATLMSVVSWWSGSVRLAAALPLVWLAFSPYVPGYELAVLLIPALGMCSPECVTVSRRLPGRGVR